MRNAVAAKTTPVICKTRYFWVFSKIGIAVQVQSMQSVGFLLDELLLHGSAVLEHVGGGVGVEADGFGGLTVFRSFFGIVE